MPEDEIEDAGPDAPDVQGEGEEPIEPTHDPFPFKVWALVSSNQSHNGLRHHDHLRYRQYCTRRLRRLFCTLKFKHGKGRFRHTDWPKDFQDIRYLEVPVVNAERAWSYGMQLKADNANSAEINCRWRYHSIRRFAKAAKWAQFLEAECKRHGDQRCQLEAEAYCAFLEGTLWHEKEEWSQALEKFNKCKRTCEHLRLAAGSEEGPVFKSKVEELGPLIRECKYNMGIAYDDDEDTGAAKSSGTKKDLSGLSYRGHGLAIPSDKIGSKLNKCVDMAKGIEAGPVDEENVSVIERYGEVSAEFHDTLGAIHNDMIAAGSDGQTDEWRMLEAFAREQSICINVERNLVLLRNHFNKIDQLEEIGTQEARRACRVEEGIRYCDMLKEDLDGLKELPDTSDEQQETLGAYAASVRNCRCFFLALVFFTVGKTLESQSLMDMLRNRVDDEEVAGKLPGCLGRLQPLLAEVCRGLPTRVAQWRCRGMAALCGDALKKGKDLVAAAPASSLKDDLSALDAFPPKFRDVPCKPLLIDLAFPEIVAPDIDEVLTKKGDQKGLLGKVAGGLGGLTGRLGGFLGRK